MPREFMIGTLDDKPLLKVVVDDLVYFLDLDTKVVVEDKPGLPVLLDKDLIKRVLEVADKIT
ncbi:hypothetical protein J0I05_04965 [Candidatus Saccharibacteria bacterium]|nr:hypothetical protein [Candidatus Saccharibacteria bacterium]